MLFEKKKMVKKKKKDKKRKVSGKGKEFATSQTNSFKVAYRKNS